MSLLTAKALGFGDGDALQTNFLQRFLHFVELERLNDSLDLLHSGLHSGTGRVPQGCMQGPCQLTQD